MVNVSSATFFDVLCLIIDDLSSPRTRFRSTFRSCSCCLVYKIISRDNQYSQDKTCILVCKLEKEELRRGPMVL